MIDKNVVARIVEEWLEDKSYFLVDVNVSPDDKIVVEIDHAEGVWIDDCVELSRYICLLYTSPSPRDLSTSRMPSSA